MVTPTELIAELPPYKDLWITIHPDQKVKDIINEVCDAHEEFAPYYDKIAWHFEGENSYQVAQNIYDFLKQNIKYKEESDRDQTTALPTGLLVRRKGDCKHYSSFTAGILDALNRAGDKINWCYRFASYKISSKIPHHVFVVINPGTGNEIWIDPTPNAEKMTPVWQVDKKIHSTAMLNRNIGNITPLEMLMPATQSHSVGTATINVTPAIDADNINFDGTGRYKNVFGHYLGLSDYRDYSGDRNFDAAATAAALNNLIAAGPAPGFAVTPDFVKWIYNESIRSWNFFYPGGVVPGFSAENLLPAGWPKLVITPDQRLTFDHDVKVDDYRNAEIHLLTAWTQDLLNRFDTIQDYPVKPRHLKEFSQSYTGNPGNTNANLFKEARGAAFFKEVGKGLEKVLNIAKAGVLKISGSIPRNAFLVLCGLNIFNIAKQLQDKITAGQWEKIAKRWKSIGGNPDKLLSTINHGKDKPEPPTDEQSTETIGEPLTAAAVIAAAAPVIAAMLAFIPDPKGKLHNVLEATKSAAASLFPNLDLDAYGFLDNTTGQHYEFETDPADDENLGGGNDNLPGMGNDPLSMLKSNPVIAAAGVGAALYFIPKKKNIIVAAVAAVATYFYLNTGSNQKTLLQQIAIATGLDISQLGSKTESELLAIGAKAGITIYPYTKVK